MFPASPASPAPRGFRPPSVAPLPAGGSPRSLLARSLVMAPDGRQKPPGRPVEAGRGVKGMRAQPALAERPLEAPGGRSCSCRGFRDRERSEASTRSPEPLPRGERESARGTPRTPALTGGRRPLRLPLYDLARPLPRSAQDLLLQVPFTDAEGEGKKVRRFYGFGLTILIASDKSVIASDKFLGEPCENQGGTAGLDRCRSIRSTATPAR